MADLKIANFNLAFFQRPRGPLADETFSEVLSLVLPYFPIINQASNPILMARRKEGGEISMTPVFLQFSNFSTEDYNSDIELTKRLADAYFKRYKTEKVHQIVIRFASITDAIASNGERSLLKEEHFTLKPETRSILTTSNDVRIGIRLVFRREVKRYDVRVEPYFNKIESNYIDFNVVLQDIDASPDDVYGLVRNEFLFFQDEFSLLIP